MTDYRFIALPSETVRSYQDDGPDDNGQVPERFTSDGDGLPCRHCLEDIAEGDDVLLLNHRPFPEKQPFAESGPIFIHGKHCSRYPESSVLPPVLQSRAQLLVRGYGADDRIVYGTGQVIKTERLPLVAEELFARIDIAYLHVRSATNNCYTCRIERA